MIRLSFALLLLTGCAIAPLPPEPDPVTAALRQEGALPIPDAAQAASCVSLAVPASFVQVRRSGVAVRPAPGTVLPGARPDYALVLDRGREGPVDWRLLVAENSPEGAAVARSLGQALTDCAARLGGTA